MTRPAGHRPVPVARRIRLAGAAAIAAGILRVVTSFRVPEDAATRELVYLLIDLLILFGLAGIYAARSHAIGNAGFAGFVLATAGAAAIAGPDGRIGSVDMYVAGSLALGTGAILLGVSAWRAGTLPWWVALLWLTSMVSGVLGASAGVPGLFAVSGVAFGVALAGAGLDTWRAAGPGR